jgi:SAM-dependent methyltransferase
MKLRITKGRTLSRHALDRVMREQLPRLGQRQRVLDIGGKHSPYRHLLAARAYWDLDIVERLQPNVLCDAHLLPFGDASVDTVLANQTLEHCKAPQFVVDETRRVLARGGVAVFSVPFSYIIHGDPSDYWRFTRFALEELFRQFAQIEILPVGNHFTAVWDLATAGCSLARYANYLLYGFTFPRNGRCPSGYVVIARK